MVYFCQTFDPISQKVYKVLKWNIKLVARIKGILCVWR